MKTAFYLFSLPLVLTLSSCRYFGCSTIDCAPCPSNFGVPLLRFQTEGPSSFSQNELDSITYHGSEIEGYISFSQELRSTDLNIDPDRNFQSNTDTGYVYILEQDTIVIHSIRYQNITPEGDGGCCGICPEYEFLSVTINDSIYTRELLPLLILNQ